MQYQDLIQSALTYAASLLVVSEGGWGVIEYMAGHWSL